MKIYMLTRKGKLSPESEKKRRKLKNSLYLAYHFGDGRKREYEFLDLFVYDKPKTQLEKDHNKETTQLAETIRAKKVIDAQSTAHGFVSSVRSKVGFLAFFKKLTEKRFGSDGNYGNWFSTYQHLNDYLQGNDIAIERVDDRFLESFKEYLFTCNRRKGAREEALSQNTVLSYFCKVRVSLREAYNNRMIRDNPITRVKPVKAADLFSKSFLLFSYIIFANI